jgi:hypothetical protein
VGHTAKPACAGRCGNLLRRDNRGLGELVDRLPKGRRAPPRGWKSLAQSAADAAQAPIKLESSWSARQTAKPAMSATAAAVPASAIWTDILQVAVLTANLLGFDCNTELSNLWRAMPLGTLSLVCRPRYAGWWPIPSPRAIAQTVSTAALAASARLDQGRRLSLANAPAGRLRRGGASRHTWTACSYSDKAGDRALGHLLDEIHPCRPLAQTLASSGRSMKFGGRMVLRRLVHACAVPLRRRSGQAVEERGDEDDESRQKRKQHEARDDDALFGPAPARGAGVGVYGEAGRGFVLDRRRRARGRRCL